MPESLRVAICGSDRDFRINLYSLDDIDILMFASFFLCVCVWVGFELFLRQNQFNFRSALQEQRREERYLQLSFIK